KNERDRDERKNAKTRQGNPRAYARSCASFGAGSGKIRRSPGTAPCAVRRADPPRGGRRSGPRGAPRGGARSGAAIRGGAGEPDPRAPARVEERMALLGPLGDERAWLAQALVERLLEPLEARVIDDGASSGAVELVARREALAAVPGEIASFCRELDLRLVQLQRREAGAWEAVLAWSDDVGRPRFLAAAVYADWYRDGVMLLSEAELRETSADIAFIQRLLKCVSRGELDDEDGQAISALWHEAPRQAMEQVARFWRRPPDIRIVAQAARQGIWSHVRANLPR